ncbi:hypothetical protein Pmani_005651 [Petrolisthes manimaculis]|uniref:Uncharacterized protein n=1 Tax=Petrolisthes manimaculis TaxID=1843537 RepID=A0AAE1QCJ9_9EUCA|nr:hypothetical protein Pmani_005651 [Petrolisthes manimaculis]
MTLPQIILPWVITGGTPDKVTDKVTPLQDAQITCIVYYLRPITVITPSTITTTTIITTTTTTITTTKPGKGDHIMVEMDSHIPNTMVADGGENCVVLRRDDVRN